jgi:hypothetical protein
MSLVAMALFAYPHDKDVNEEVSEVVLYTEEGEFSFTVLSFLFFSGVPGTVASPPCAI